MQKLSKQYINNTKITFVTSLILKQIKNSNGCTPVHTDMSWVRKNTKGITERTALCGAKQKRPAAEETSAYIRTNLIKLCFLAAHKNSTMLLVCYNYK